MSTLVINVWGKTVETRLIRRRYWAAMQSILPPTLRESLKVGEYFGAALSFREKAKTLQPCVDHH